MCGVFKTNYEGTEYSGNGQSGVSVYCSPVSRTCLDVIVMDTYEKIENMIADKYGAGTTTRKAIGDFMLSDTHAVNVKSNNVKKQNYSPNMISIKKMHKWVYEQKNDLSFIFVDYEINGENISVLNETALIPIEHLSWDCLSIEAQGYGVIQMNRSLTVCDSQTKQEFYKGFLKAYDKFMQKERKKHEAFSKTFIIPR